MELKPASPQPARAPFWCRLADILLELLEIRANHYRFTAPSRRPPVRRQP